MASAIEIKSFRGTPKSRLATNRLTESPHNSHDSLRIYLSRLLYRVRWSGSSSRPGQGENQGPQSTTGVCVRNRSRMRGTRRARLLRVTHTRRTGAVRCPQRSRRDHRRKGVEGRERFHRWLVRRQRCRPLLAWPRCASSNEIRRLALRGSSARHSDQHLLLHRVVSAQVSWSATVMPRAAGACGPRLPSTRQWAGCAARASRARRRPADRRSASPPTS